MVLKFVYTLTYIFPHINCYHLIFGIIFYRWLDRWFLLLQIPMGAALYWYGNAAQVHGGGLGLVLWAIPLRLVLVYHVTWLVNSATHASATATSTARICRATAGGWRS